MNPRMAAGLAWTSLLAVVACGVDLAGRSMARRSWLAGCGVEIAPEGAALLAALAGGVALLAFWRGGAWSPDRAVIVVLLCAFSAGMASQQRLGARLQSDGFYYFAHLRSLWFDGDQDLTNDYHLIGFGDKAHLFVPTPTGYAQSAWTIGPSLVWAPFFFAGDRIAHGLAARGHDVKTDGTSYPYRQAVCVAGLFWGLAGLFASYRLARLFVPAGWAAAGMAVVALGSFILWYLVKEPSMTHGPSMAAVAFFSWAWAATRGTRTRWQWLALGLAAGLMGTIRWQNTIFALLPAVEWLSATAALWARGDRRAVASSFGNGVVFTAAAVVGFAPQMLVWKAIYGSWLAISPVGPQIRWWDSHWADVLWSSRNGLLSSSPVLYVAALGLLRLWRLDRVMGIATAAALSAMVFFNGAIQDWWGSAAFGGRRFDGTIPLFVVGAALAGQAAADFVARRPRLVVGLAGAALVVWNLTFVEAALGGLVRLGEPVAFGPVAGRQATTLHRWIGHPFAYPANLIFAIRNGVSPGDYDSLWALRFLSDPARPYGRIDIGGEDALAIGEGWHEAESAGGVAYRWAGERAALRLALDHAADLDVQVRARAFDWPGSPAQRLVVEVNGAAQAPLAVPAEWTTVSVRTPAAAWRSGINHVWLASARAARPADVGPSGDGRRLAVAVDWVRVAVAPR